MIETIANKLRTQRLLPACPLAVITLSLAIAGCNGESNGITGMINPSDNSGGAPNTNPDPDDNQATSQFDPKLESVGDASSYIRTVMLDYYTNQRMEAIGGSSVDAEVVFAEETDSLPDSVSDSGSNDTSARFSDTNVQESGVDESDRVKLDGNIMFAMEELSSGYVGVVPVPRIVEGIETSELSVADDLWIPPQPQTMLSVYQLNQENSRLLSRLEIEDYPSGMYLHKNGGDRDLVLLSSGSFDWAYWSMPSHFLNSQTVLRWVNANNPNDLMYGRTMTIDGQLISSRKIDNQLILVTRFHPTIAGITTPYNDAIAERNREIIESADDSTFTPGYTLISGGSESSGRIINNDQCYTNADSPPVQDHDEEVTGPNDQSTADTMIPYYESPSVILIVTVDLNTQSPSVKSTCFIGESEAMYVSQNSMYLATTQYRYSVSEDTLSRPMVRYYPPEITTEVHKFSFRSNAAPEFRGSASVSGHLGWYSDRKPFRMSEKSNNLRIVTFDESRSGSPVTLNILAEGDGATLQTLSTLPNDNRPEPIGKPNENLYASRFIGDRAYLVTFRITDPLYVLDVSDPHDPFIAGELELPGYSDYLHPVNERLLIGLGKDAVPAQETSWGDGRGAFYQGVKLNLFDVSDPTNPYVADDRVFGKRGTDSPALYQHHSFAWLSGGEDRNARFAIPLSLHDEPLQGQAPAGWSDWTANKLLKMEVDEFNQVFVDVPDWVFESRENGYNYSPVSLHNDRAVLDGDGGLYVIHNGSLQYGLWERDAPSVATE